MLRSSSYVGHLIRGLVVSSLIVVYGLSSGVAASGEQYILEGGALTVSGGNISTITDSPSISLPSTGEANQFGLNSFTVREDYCLDGSARITVGTNASTSTITAVDFSCTDPGRIGDDFRSLADWSTGVRYTTSSTNPPPSSGGGIDVSGVEVLRFANPTGSAIRACDGLFKQFSGNGCIDFNAVAGSEITYRAEVNALATNCTGTASARQSHFRIVLVEPRVVNNDRLPADFTVEQRSTCPGMNYKGWDNNPPRRINISNANQLTEMLGNEVESEEPEATSNCRVDGGLGWILCPMMNTMADINDAAFGAIEYFLKTPPLIAYDNQGNMVPLDQNGIYMAWSYVRSLANVLLVIAFLFIIFSQVTSMGISNYGVKKMIPKIVAGAILINISYWLAALAVDASNVIGSSTYNILTDPSLISATQPGSGSDPSTWGHVTGLVLMGGLGIGAAVMAGMAVLLPLAVSAFFMIIGLVFVLTFRHAMVFILIVAAPLAIAAYMLPNTEGMFRTWWKMLRVLLLIYPAIAFIMGISTVAASFTFSAANMMTDTFGKVIMQMIAVAMPAMGIFAGIMLAKTMGSVMNKLGISSPLKPMTDAAKNKAAAAGTAARDGRRSFMTDRANKARAAGKRRAGVYGVMGGGVGRALQSRKDAKKSQRESREAIYSESGGLGNLEEKYQKEARNSRIVTTAATESSKQNDLIQFANTSDKELLDNLAGGSPEMFKTLKGQRNQAVHQAAAGMKGEYASMTSDKLGVELQRSILDGDSVRTQAIVNQLDGMGATGVKQMRQAYETVDSEVANRKANGTLSEGTSRAYGQFNSAVRSSGAKAKDAVLYDHGVNEGVLGTGGLDIKTRAETDASGGLISGLSDSQIASQANHDNIENAIARGELSAERAQQIIQNPSATADANAGTLDILSKHAATATSAPSAQPNAGGTPPSANGSPSGSGAPSGSPPAGASGGYTGGVQSSGLWVPNSTRNVRQPQQPASASSPASGSTSSVFTLDDQGLPRQGNTVGNDDAAERWRRANGGE